MKLSTIIVNKGDAVEAGTVEAFATNIDMNGWLPCTGAVYSKVSFKSLYEKIGTTYNTGGEGPDEFRLPDYRGKFLRGLDLGRGVDIGRTIAANQAPQIGQHAHNVGSLALAGAPGPSILHPHTGSLSTSSPITAGFHDHLQRVGANVAPGPGVRHDWDWDAYSASKFGGRTETANAPHTHAVTYATTNAPHSHPNAEFSGSVGATGGTQNASEWRPRNVAVKFMIKT
jgi:microcystin-dependent protein